MRRILNSALVFVLSVVLAASGAALALPSHATARAAAATPQPPAHHHAGLHAHHHVDHAAIANEADEPGPPPAGHDAFVTCCSMCTLSSPLQPITAATVIFTVSAVVFSSPESFEPGRTVQVDPGIPKHAG